MESSAADGRQPQYWQRCSSRRIRLRRVKGRTCRGTPLYWRSTTTSGAFKSMLTVETYGSFSLTSRRDHESKSWVW